MESLEHFSIKVILKIINFSFFFSILDQFQIRISNGLGARAGQGYLPICENAYFAMGLLSDNGNVSTRDVEAIDRFRFGGWEATSIYTTKWKRRRKRRKRH